MLGRTRYLFCALALGLTLVSLATKAQEITEQTVTGFDVFKAMKSGEFTMYYEGNSGNWEITQAVVLDRNDGLPLTGAMTVYTKETNHKLIASRLNEYAYLGGISEIRMDGKVIGYVTPGDSTYGIYLVNGGYVITIISIGTGFGDPDSRGSSGGSRGG